MKKTSLLGRIAQLLKASANDAIDKAEDPLVMIDQLIREFRENTRNAEQAIAETIGQLRMAEDDHREHETKAREWGEKARLAVARAELSRAQDDDGDAAKLDRLAEVAVSRQIDAERRAQDAVPGILAQRQVTAQLKNGLEGMKQRLVDLEAKRSSLATRMKSAEAQSRVNEVLGGLNSADPTSELGRFEQQVKRKESLVRGQQELQASSVEHQFAELESEMKGSEVQQRLAALKRGEAPALASLSAVSSAGLAMSDEETERVLAELA